ncbi:MAG TPA: ABC transporter substrate-binding protein, partial [Thermofilum sp.]|nr:ABC transporter substrate-binding protein [Thermofilum sp.]
MKKLFVLLALLMLLFPSVSLSNEKRIAIYASLSEMTTLDPSTEFSNSIIVLAVTYETLLRYDPLKNEFIPVLAE